MATYKPFPISPEPADARRIKKEIKRLLAEYLPTLDLNDRKGRRRLAAMKFKAALKVAIKNNIELSDKRSLTVEVHYTLPPSSTKNTKYHWVVVVGYDRRSQFREITVMEPVELA